MKRQLSKQNWSRILFLCVSWFLVAGIADLATSCATQYVRAEAPVFVLETVESVVGSVNEATKDTKPTPTVTANKLPELINEVLRDLNLV